VRAAGWTAAGAELRAQLASCSAAELQRGGGGGAAVAGGTARSCVRLAAVARCRAMDGMVAGGVGAGAAAAGRSTSRGTAGRRSRRGAAGQSSSEGMAGGRRSSCEVGPETRVEDEWSCDRFGGVPGFLLGTGSCSVARCRVFSYKTVLK
jgi:hypothetical protein